MRYKVLHIITRLDKGGSAENTLLTVLGLNKDRYDVTLIKGTTLESVMSDEEREANERDLKRAEDSGVKVITIDELVRRISPLNDLKAFIKLFSVIRSEKYHIVHTHTSKAGILGRWAAWLCRFGKLTKTTVIIHTPHGHIFYGYCGKFLTWIFKVIEQITALVTDMIITLTDREKKEHIDFKIAPPEKFITIHSGVEVKKFFGVSPEDIKKAREELNIPDDYLVVGTVGRLVEIKGHKYFIQAAQKIINSLQPSVFSLQSYKGIKFIIVGDGPLMTNLKREAESPHPPFSKGGAGGIIFTGWRNDVPVVMSTFDIFVLPSLNEGMGKVLVEAMLLKKPIIASRVGGIPDLIRDGENGILINPASPDDLAKAVVELIKSEDKRVKMGNSGRLMAESYSDRVMVEKIESLYNLLIKN